MSKHQFLDEDIKLLINIDRLPLFKSSSMQLWPILIQFHKFQPVPVALYGGYLKPNMNEFLREFIAEIKTLISSPAQILNKQYNISIFCLTCDAPARSLLKGIIQHTGYYACERCTIKGRSLSDRIKETVKKQM